MPVPDDAGGSGEAGGGGELEGRGGGGRGGSAVDGGGGNERGDLSEKDYAYMSYIPYISCICPIYN